MEVDQSYYPMDVDDDVQQMLAREIAHMRQAPSIYPATNNLPEQMSRTDESNQTRPEPCSPPPFAWEVQQKASDWSTPNESANANPMSHVVARPNSIPITLTETPFGSHYLALVVDTNYLISYLSFMKDLMRWLPTPQMLVVIPYVVIKELDSLKEPHKRTVAPLAQAVEDRVINPLNTINEGVSEAAAGGGERRGGDTVFISLVSKKFNNDDRILECARFVRARITPNVLMMTNDKNLGIKSRIHGIDVAAHYKGSAQAFLNDIRISLGQQPIPIVAGVGNPVRKANGAMPTNSTPKSEPRWGPVGNQTTAAAGVPDPPLENSKPKRKRTADDDCSPTVDSLSAMNVDGMDIMEEGPGMGVAEARATNARGEIPFSGQPSAFVNLYYIAAPKGKKKRKSSVSTAVPPLPSPPPAPISTKAQGKAAVKSQQQQYEGVQNAKKTAIKSGTSGDALDIVCSEVCRTLPPLLTIGFQHVFDAFDRAQPDKALNLTSPPWSLEELFRMLEKHWKACFSALLGNNAFDARARKFCLDKSTSIVRGLKYGRTGATLGELRELVDHLIKFAGLLRKSGCLAQLHDARSVERLLQGLKEKLQPV
ncbi:hypothetical protein HDU87_000121 [Geranomyces variabilis]|uniref:PIN domain-containing protein n=1 Tax=Geranomyces variabilis TaxID=109894 RepID=A0AAD5TU79_9FUNG|nr:hypothetical protein HDU87_000121 [Geranomyces variabilis]